MKRFHTKQLTALAALALAGTNAGALAQTPSEGTWPPPGVSYNGDPASPDISGVWLGSIMGIPGGAIQSNYGKSADGSPPVFWAPWPLPYTPEYQKVFDERVAATARGQSLGDIGARCLPPGMPRMIASKTYPDEIVQTPGSVTFFMFNMFPVVVWTDGRGHPANLKPSYNGHSTGHWVGDTLFVETVGLKPDNPIDTMRNPHSGSLKLEWTVRKVGPDVIHVHLTMIDPEAFSEPVTMTNIWRRKSDPKWQVLDDASCFENASGISEKPPADGFFRF